MQQSEARRLLPDSGYVLPLWVTAIADCSRPLAASKSTSLKTDLRNIRKHGLECVEASDPEDFWYFWDRMYVPYTQHSYGNEALIESREEFGRQLDNNCLRLFFVTHEGRRVAGGVGNFAGDVPCFRYLGILDADPNARKIGVLAALYIFDLRIARSMGYASVNFGGCRSFLNDGVLQFKKKFDIRLENTSCRRILYVNPLTIDDAVTACLTANPMIRLDGNKLVATLFEDGNAGGSAEDSLWNFNGNLIPGLDRVERVTLTRESPPHVRVLSLNQA